MILMSYTILIKSKAKTFNIKFSISNVPKDIWDHRDAVEDYLIDTTAGYDETIPEFEILTYKKEIV